MLYSLTTTPIEVYAPRSADAWVKFSAGNFSADEAVYIRPVNTQKPWLILNGAGKSGDQILVPHGTQLEAYTSAGTADLAVLKTCCSADPTQQ